MMLAMKRSLYVFSAMMVAAAMAATITACGDDDPKQDYNPLIDDPKQEEPSKPNEPTVKNSYDELYRPQIHFTPAKNWMNDPNGMVYADGTYHLFYQYNPQGNDWGNMSWGHATSTDLMHWAEQPVALTRDELGDIFSGSAVIDKDNTADFGANAMVALYTSASGAQQQSLAYSTDGGKNFTRFASNPVIKNDDDNLRDPKVFWHEPTKKWVMALAKGWKMGVEFYGSTDLKSWHHLSTFHTELKGRPSLQWECPDLFELGVRSEELGVRSEKMEDGSEELGANGSQELLTPNSSPLTQNKWVLLVSVNPGGPLVGSGTMYFTGQFDGTNFIADEREYPLWLDYGMDNYAGVTWSNTGDRRIMIGWMNNWSYAGAVPCSPWRSAFTLPRELTLTEYEGRPLLCSTVVSEIDKIAGPWSDRHPASAGGEAINAKSAYQLRLTIALDRSTTVTLANNVDEAFSFDISAAARMLTAHRTAKTGKTSFNGTFSLPSMNAPLCVEGNKVTLDIFVDQSSVEIFTQQGTMAMTNLVFPQSLYNRLIVEGADCEVQVRELKRIWD